MKTTPSALRCKVGEAPRVYDAVCNHEPVTIESSMHPDMAIILSSDLETMKKELEHLRDSKVIVEDDFYKCVNIKCEPKTVTVNCKLDLWSVISNTYENALTEACNYFEQYKNNGEYHQIIGGESSINKLMKG